MTAAARTPRYGLIPKLEERRNTANMPSAMTGPCERLMTFMTPKMSVRPIAARP